MGIKDFFKKIFIKEEEKETKLGFHEIESHLHSLKNEKKKEEQIVLKQISNLVSELVIELKINKEILDKINLKEKKEEERVKILVLDGLSSYSEQIGKLANSLEKDKMESLEKSINELNEIFADFTQKSRISYEKATILIGKEMANIKDVLKKFFNELGEVLQENKKLIQTLKIIENTEEKLIKMENIERERREINRNLEEIEKKILEFSEKEKTMEKKIEEIKKSENYLLMERERKDATQNKLEIEKEIISLRNAVDFKELERTFHSDEKKMKIIHGYKNDFNQIFENTNELILLISDEKRKEIKDFVERIKGKRKKSEEILSQKDDSKIIELELAYIKTQKEKIIEEKEKEKKRAEKNMENIEVIKKEISENLSELKIDIA